MEASESGVLPAEIGRGEACGAGGFLGMQCHIFLTGTGEAEEVRSHFRRFMSRGHDGWDDAFDRQFDDRAVWFHLVDNHGKQQAGLRLIFQRVGPKEGPLPSELGDLALFRPPPRPRPASGGDVALSDRPTCESSGLYFRNRRALAALLPIFIRWMNDRRLGPVYSLYDASNEFVHWLQCELLCFRHIAGRQVTYESFRYRNGGPVTWQATLLDPLMRIQSLANAWDHAWETWEGLPPRIDILDDVPAAALEPVIVPTPAGQLQQD